MRANSRRTSRNKKLAYAGVAIALTIFIFTLTPSAVSFVSTLIITPIEALTSWAQNSNGTLPTYLRNREELEQHISELEQQIAEKSSNDLTLNKLQHENGILRNLMGTVNNPRLIANVIARPPDLPYDLMQIDQGSERGVKVGAPVFLGYDQLIGIISHTTEHTSFVELITSPGFRSTVYIYGPDIFTKAEGYGGGIMRVNVPQGITLQEGNIVIVPSQDSGIYGTIGHIQTSPTQPEQYGFVVPTTPIQSIHKVAVGAREVQKIDYETAASIVSDNRVGTLEIDIPLDLLVIPATTSATGTEEQ